MRFLFVDRKGATAIWSVINPIAQALVADGHEVTFARLDDGAQRAPLPAPSCVDVRDLEVPPGILPFGPLRQQRVFAEHFRALVRALEPDIVHTHFCVPGVVARAIARAEGVPAIVSTQHELYGSMNPPYRLAVRATQRHADAIVYVSKAVARSFGRPIAEVHPDRDPDQTPRHAVIYNGIDIDDLDRMRQTVGPVEKGKLVCAARLIELKGQRLLIEALPTILGRRPDARLVLVGSGPDEGRLRTSSARLGIAGRVQFRGWLPHEASLREMATAEAMVIPSLQEGFGLALVEAMALGVPTVASRIPVFEEVTGGAAATVSFFHAGDQWSLARVVSGVLERCPTQDQGRCPEPRVRALFSLQRMVESYRALYRALRSDAGVELRLS